MRLIVPKNQLVAVWIYSSNTYYFSMTHIFFSKTPSIFHFNCVCRNQESCKIRFFFNCSKLKIWFKISLGKYLWQSELCDQSWLKLRKTNKCWDGICVAGWWIKIILLKFAFVGTKALIIKSNNSVSNVHRLTLQL